MGEWDDAIEDGYIDPVTLSPTDHPDIEKALREQHGRTAKPVKEVRPLPNR